MHGLVKFEMDMIVQLDIGWIEHMTNMDDFCK